jgi:hypothetical protein
MLKKHPRALIGTVTASLAVAALGLAASPALAGNSGPATVDGTVQSNISLAVSSPAAFTTGFQPNSVAQTTGAIVATSTSASPALTVVDSTSSTNPGQMHLLTSTGCTGSEAVLANPLMISVAGSGVTSAGSVPLSGTSATVATASGPLVAAALTATYAQTIGSEPLVTPCAYTVTATYTLS